MNRDDGEIETIVSRSREISEARWPAIKDELDNTKSVAMTESAACVEPDDHGSFVPPSRSD